MNKRTGLLWLLLSMPLFLHSCGSAVDGKSGPQLVRYDFTGQVDFLTGDPGFPVALDDAVTGTFSIDPLVKDINPNPQQGMYPQTAPTGVEVYFASTVFRADPASFPPYRIAVLNDVAGPQIQPADTLQWSAGDPSLASLLKVGNVQATMFLQDETAAVFANDALPARIDLHDFSQAWISLNAVNFRVNGADCLWGIHVRLDSIKQR